MEYIYNIIAGTEILVCLLLISHYVYLEPTLSSRKGWYGLIGCFFICMAVIQVPDMIPEDIEIIIPFVFFGIYIVSARRRRKIRGIFLVIPVSGLLFSFVSLAFTVPYILNGSVILLDRRYYIVLDALLWAGLLIFWLRGKGRNWRAKFEQELAFRMLTLWERRLLNITGSFLFFLAVMMICVNDILTAGMDVRALLAVGSLGAALLEITLIAMVVQGNRKSYYHQVAAMNERYLKTELEHFEAYRKNQEETRRIRHDMKNHLLCLREMAETGCTDDIKNYLDSLSSRVSQTEAELHCGNDIADAILNEKYRSAREKGIRIQVQGRIVADMHWDPLDICTIFSNALDNAIEALERQAPSDFEPWIHVGCSNQGLAQLIVFENPVNSHVVIGTDGHTEKPDKDSHGFGIFNIRLAAEKYQGQVSRTVEHRDGCAVYRLEVLLFAHR